MIMTKPLLAFAGMVLIAPTMAWAQAEDTGPGPATASRPSVTAALTLTLESAGDIERTIALYQCESGETLAVQYINAAPNFLAIVPVEGENYIFATTISGSGARYVSGPYEWWSHQGEGTLRDMMQDEDAEPLATCTASSNTP
jgi:membrane-bound inhibitor of C-type lysozyme